MHSLFLLAYLLLASSGVDAHSWVEQMRIIKDGAFTGNPGYIRGYVPRGPGFADVDNENLLPPLASGRTRINGTDAMCMSSQTKPNQTTGYPKLSASPGDYVALRYLENGHVTLPQNQLGKPGSGGTVMVYATADPKEDEKLTDVLKWNTDGTGGDKRGRLLTAQNFDDGRCYQINNSPMSTQRQQEFPNKPANAPPGTANSEMWCETDVQLPKDAATGKDLTLYWAWQWDTQPNVDPGIPDGKDEWYTSCMDVSILSASGISKAALPVPKALLVQDPQQKANPAFTQRAANQTLPFGGPDGGDGNPGDSGPPSSAPVAAPPTATPSTPAPASSAAPAPAPTGTTTDNLPSFGPGTSLLPIPGNGGASTDAPPAPSQPPTVPAGAPGGSHGHGTGKPHLLTLTQVLTVTINYKRSIQTVTTEVVDYSAPKRRNIWA